MKNLCLTEISSDALSVSAKHANFPRSADVTFAHKLQAAARILGAPSRRYLCGRQEAISHERQYRVPELLCTESENWP
jgi:hypothetical protein